MTDVVLFHELETTGGKRIGVATLNAARTLNALSLDMVNALRPQLAAWADDPAIAMVMLQGDGDKAFCAGGDLHGLYRDLRAHPHEAGPDGRYGAPGVRTFFEGEYRLDYAIHTYPKPILCWGNGVVMGGGMGLMSGASHRVVTEHSRLAMPEVVIGLFPDVAGSWFLNRMPGKAGLFMALTGSAIGAADAMFAGWADYHLAHSLKQTVVDQLCGRRWSGKRREDDATVHEVLQGLQSQPQPAVGPLREHLDYIGQLCSAPTLAGIVHAILHQKSGIEWLAKAAATLAAGSPASARISHELLRRTRLYSLAQVFQLEFSLALRCAARADFAEGIRALLVDKDRKPAWQPATLAGVDEDWVDALFDQAARFDTDHPLADLHPMR
jgi:enoyl-CoA hydratase/carnithine racemase